MEEREGVAHRSHPGIERWAKRARRPRQGLDLARLATVMALGIALRLKMASGKEIGLRIRKSVWMCLRGGDG